MKMIQVFFLVAGVFSCQQKAYDNSKAVTSSESLVLRIQKSNSVIDTMADLPLYFLIQNAEVDYKQYCSYTVDLCGSLYVPKKINQKLIEGDTFVSKKLSRFADFATRGFTREEAVASIRQENLADDQVTYLATDATYKNFNYNDELLNQDYFFNNVKNESAIYTSHEKPSSIQQFEVFKTSTIKREFLSPVLDPRNDSFINIVCEVRSGTQFTRYDFGAYKLVQTSIISLLKTQITKGDIYCGSGTSFSLIGQGTQTIQEVSSPNAKMIVIGVGQLLYRNQDIVLDSGKRILSSTFKIDQLPQ